VCLIGADDGNKNNRISRFANYLRNLLPSADPAVMELAAKTVGKLALYSGTYSDQYVEFEVKRAFEWLGGVRNEPKRYAAVSKFIYMFFLNILQLIQLIYTKGSHTKRNCNYGSNSIFSTCCSIF